jgi:hypothetical protein
MHADSMGPVQEAAPVRQFFQVHDVTLLHEAISDASFFNGGETGSSAFQAAVFLFLPTACCFNRAMNSSNDVFDSAAPDIYEIKTSASGPAGSLPITEDMLLKSPSGDLFGLTQNVGMGWSPAESSRKQFLILSTQGGLRAPDGKPIALGYHTGHWEIGLLVRAAAKLLEEQTA